MSEKPVGTPEQKKSGKRNGYLRALWSTLRTLLLIALLTFVAAHYFFPVLRLHTDGMAPAIRSGDVVVALKGEKWQRGDIVALYYNDKLLVKRIAAVGGDVISIDETGAVTLNGQLLAEPYVTQKALGNCDIDMPFTVPDGYVFVMGDNRQLSLDSRSTAIGCVAQEQIVGRVLMCLWPLDHFEIY